MDWKAELRRYGAYVAVNRVHLELRDVLAKLGLARFARPQRGVPLKSPEDIREALQRYKGLLAESDVENTFERQLERYDAVVKRDLVEAHAYVNGKWLIDHMAAERTRRPARECRARWVQHAIASGGHPDVRSLWSRILSR